MCCCPCAVVHARGYCSCRRLLRHITENGKGIDDFYKSSDGYDEVQQITARAGTGVITYILLTGV
jgi:hypothetical protein